MVKRDIPGELRILTWDKVIMDHAISFRSQTLLLCMIEGQMGITWFLYTMLFSQSHAI